MGSPPPDDAPAPIDTSNAADSSCSSSNGVSGSAGGNIGLDVGSTHVATICGFSIDIPSLKFSISLFLALLIAFAIPFDFHLSFKLSCDLSNPIDISGGLSWAGGRCSNAPPDPDDDENAS